VANVEVKRKKKRRKRNGMGGGGLNVNGFGKSLVARGIGAAQYPNIYNIFFSG